MVRYIDYPDLLWEHDLDIDILIYRLRNYAKTSETLEATITITDYDETGSNPTVTEIANAALSVSGTNAEIAHYWIDQILNRVAADCSEVVLNGTDFE